MYIEEIKPGFPDCIGRRFVGKGWERVSIEFEYLSQNFVQHKHDPKNCDIIICWEHNWKDCPIEVIELKSEIQGLENYPTLKPKTQKANTNENAENLRILIEAIKPSKKIVDWYETIYSQLLSDIDSFWAKISTKYIGFYSPDRSFASIMINKQSIKVECFCGDNPIPGTKIANQRFSPRWCKMTMKTEDELENVIKILKDSHGRINHALKSGETTGYYSGGEFSSANNDPNKAQDEE
jgi:hypothetical protein